MEAGKFQACLFEDIVPNVTYGTIIGDKSKSTQVTKSVTKKALNPIYWKMKVCENLVDVEPFHDGENYL